MALQPPYISQSSQLTTINWGLGSRKRPRSPTKRAEFEGCSVAQSANKTSTLSYLRLNGRVCEVVYISKWYVCVYIYSPISIYHCLSINNIYICNKSIHWCDLLIFLNHPKQRARRSSNFHEAAHTERYYLPPPQPPHIFVEELKARSFWRSRKPQTYSTNYMPIYHVFFKYISATYARVETQCMLRML